MREPSLLVFGLTGQLGDALRQRGLPPDVLAVSRHPPLADTSVLWRESDLQRFADPQVFDAVLSLGPLDAFATAVSEGRVLARRIVAFGSTSVHAKADSPVAAEREVARRLAEAEAALSARCRTPGCTLFILRPTLVWGLGRDANLSRVMALARRWPSLPLPLDAPGLRQPVHARDLAAAALAALTADPANAGAYDLPGGETLSFGAMLARSLAVAVPTHPRRVVPWRLAAVLGRLSPRTRGLAGRLGSNLVFHTGPAHDALGWTPRGFQPTSADFPIR